MRIPIPKNKGEANINAGNENPAKNINVIIHPRKINSSVIGA